MAANKKLCALGLAEIQTGVNYLASGTEPSFGSNSLLPITSHAYIIRLLNDLRIELTLAATHEFQSTIEKTQ